MLQRHGLLVYHEGPFTPKCPVNPCLAHCDHPVTGVCQIDHVGTLRSPYVCQIDHVGTLRSPCVCQIDHVGTLRSSCVCQTDHIGTMRSSCVCQIDHVGTLRSPCVCQIDHVGTLRSPCVCQIDHVGTLWSPYNCSVKEDRFTVSLFQSQVIQIDLLGSSAKLVLMPNKSSLSMCVCAPMYIWEHTTTDRDDTNWWASYEPCILTACGYACMTSAPTYAQFLCTWRSVAMIW